MQTISNAARRRVALLLCAFIICVAGAPAQSPRAKHDQNVSDSDDAPASAAASARTRRATDARPLGDNPTDILRAARTIYLAPNRHLEADYLEYKLDKLPEFTAWQLSIVKDRDKADLILEINKTALNYIFTIIEPTSSIVVAKGKTVAINGRVAAEDISHQIVKRMRALRALPANEER